ncbi:MAG: hypothetical protein AAB868_02020 [Patescibacteria group bacterium]
MSDNLFRNPPRLVLVEAGKLFLLGILISIVFSVSTVFAKNPVALLSPASNILDPGAPNTPWGGCGPLDANCYPQKIDTAIKIDVPKSVKTTISTKVGTSTSKEVGTITNTALLSALRNLFAGPLPNDFIAKLQGPQGVQGPQGPAGASGGSVSIIQPNPTINYTGGSLFSATDLSSTNFITTGAKITTLNVSGISTLATLNVSGNTTLTDNLAVSGATTLSGNIIPSADVTYDLGSATKRFKSIYVGPGSLSVICDATECASATEYKLSVDPLTGKLRIWDGTTTFLTVNTTGDSVAIGQLSATKAPTLAHVFSTWPSGTSNVANSSLYINPASATADSNLLGAAVNGTVKFLVDADSNT